MIVLVANVALGMAFSVIVLRRSADSRRRFDVVLASSQAALSRQEAGLWRAVAEHDDASLARQVTRVARALRRTTDDVRRSGVRGSSVADAVRAQDRYTARLDSVVRSAPPTTQGLESAASAFHDDVARVAAAHVRTGARAATVADIETLLMMAFAAGMAVLLFRKFTGARRSAELRAAQERARTEARFRALVHHSSDVVLVVDTDTTIRFQTPSVEHVLGYEPSALAGTRLVDLVHPDDHLRLLALHADVVARPAVPETTTTRWRHRAGGWRHLESVHTNLLEEPDVRAIVVNARDVTERKALEDQLAHNAFHDPLTNLANRALFNDRLGHALSRRDRAPESLAVLFLDLDDFKGVNDGFGHAAGDDLLAQVATRLRGCVRSADTVARLGGDEFAILVEDASGAVDTTRVASQVLDALREPFLVDGVRVGVQASVGIALQADEAAGADELLRQADVAMYVAKANGKDRFSTFDASMDAAVLGRLELKAELRRAIEREELVVHYQPEVELATGRVIGVEALVRWQHPQRGLLPPVEFIPVAEETGLVVPLGRWVLRQACEQARRWHRRAPQEPPLGVGVNLSPRELEQPDLVDSVRDALERSGLDPASLTLEITETVVMSDLATSAEKLEQLQALGVRLAIDDFGTGYSSLSYLERLPVDVLKIDKSFVDRVATAEDPLMVRAMTQLAGALELQVVAEGVEQPAQAAELRSLGCHVGQGYYFARPLPVEALDDFLRGRAADDVPDAPEPAPALANRTGR